MGLRYDLTLPLSRYYAANREQLPAPFKVCLLYTSAGLGVRNIGQLAAAKDEDLRAALGKLGPELGAYARGEENSPVRTADERPEIKSVGNGLTFKRNLVGEADVRAGLYALADEVATRLRAHGLYAAAVQVLIKNP